MPCGAGATDRATFNKRYFFTPNTTTPARTTTRQARETTTAVIAEAAPFPPKNERRLVRIWPEVVLCIPYDALWLVFEPLISKINRITHPFKLNELILKTEYL